MFTVTINCLDAPVRNTLDNFLTLEDVVVKL